MESLLVIELNTVKDLETAFIRLKALILLIGLQFTLKCSVLHLLNKINISVVQTVGDFMIEEDLLHSILVRLDIHVPRLNVMQGILVHQLHAMQGLGPVVMIMHPHHQNRGLTQGIF